MHIEMVCRTDKGLVREHNEDSIGGEQSQGLVVLADGMGGYHGGEIASELAVKTIMEELYTPLKNVECVKRHINHRYHFTTVLLERAVLKANQEIYNMASDKIDYKNMGTTVVAALFNDNFISVAHVGDSRLYRLRGNKLSQITKDHSIRQELIDCGYYTKEQARNSPNHSVTRSLGESQVNVDIQEDRMFSRDIYLLCSDGLSDMLDDNEIYNILSKNSQLEQAAQLLIEAANAKGGKDNISLILVRPLQVTSKQRKGWLQKLFGFRKKISNDSNKNQNEISILSKINLGLQ
ncbi:protein phosphatase 2C-like protein [Beggiatoa sp. PS]|nr:protein phosphatase 2C-like protein [Beggiatoa sp. PS]